MSSVAYDSLDFRNINIFGDNDIQDSYDILMLSNILELACGNKDKIRVAFENVTRLLNANGLVLCSNMDKNRFYLPVEREIFDSGFEFIDYGVCNGYAYRKK